VASSKGTPEAVLVLSVGGPERPEDVWPFLERVAQGKNIPETRLKTVAERYLSFGGHSPHNAACRALLTHLAELFAREGPPVALYWGNRFWYPSIGEALIQMAEEGIQTATALVLSPFGSYAGCRAYREALQQARQEVGCADLEIRKLRLFYNHPLFIEAVGQRVQEVIGKLPDGSRGKIRVIFSAHSLPVSMAAVSPYVHQFTVAARLVAERVGLREFDLVYQSRSGDPTSPWLEPDIVQHLQALARDGFDGTLIVVPIGFIVENMETAYDLDVEAANVAEDLGIPLVRAGTAACTEPFLRLVRELVLEQFLPEHPREFLGADGPWPDECPPDCCRFRR
jgi:ferrochelatase